MQMEILSTAALAGMGLVLPSADSPQGVPHTIPLGPESPHLRWRCAKEAVVDYESGMASLILWGEQRRVFYLDRAVQLAAGTVFSVVPLEERCAVRLYLPYGESLETVEGEVEALSRSAAALPIGRIYTCFFQESARDFYFRGERHTPYELTYVDKGELHNLAGGTDVVLHQGEMMLVGREEWHTQYADAPVSFLTVTFDLPGDRLSAITGLALPLPPSARGAMKRFLSEQSGEQAFAYDYMEALLKILLIELLRWDSESKSDASPLPSTARSENQIVDQALQIIAQRSHTPLSLKELAGAIHVSVPYLCRLFDTHVGLPPGQYITKIRIEECKVLLRQGELSMNDIAARMGFSSPQHFSRQFRRCCGMTPTAYTRSLR